MFLFRKPARKATVRRQTTAVMHHSVLGEVTIVRNPRAKRMILAVKPRGGVRLTLPPRASEEDGLKFLNAKQEWVLAAIERQKTKGNNTPQIIGPSFVTRSHTLRLAPAQTDKIRVGIRGGHITVTYPEQLPHTDSQVQAAIRKGVEQAWRAEAQTLLPPRVEEIARRLGLHYNSVAVRNTVSRWGSCSAHNDISLSLHLLRLPDHLIDYIITHELCHTVHKNHGPRFHALLDRYTDGRHPALRRELRSYNTRW